jgi:hypothetical protein
MQTMSSNRYSTQSKGMLRAVLASRAVFFAVSALVYAVAIVSATLTLHPYFSQTWDVQTFIHAARTFADDATWFDLYARSRAAQTWPYAYPPLHAGVVALALFIGDWARVLPDYVWARVPALLADVGVAWMLHRLVARKTNDETLARAAMLLWLFNPITFYDTAVQGHFESEWLVFVLLAYASFEEKRSLTLPALALALAVLFKQIAILFALPLWIEMLKADINRAPNKIIRLAFHVLIFGFIVGIVCLPFLLYSNDFVFMNLTYVENVPTQTTSWLVAWLGWTRAEPTALTSDFFLLRYSTLVTLIAATVLAFIGARRGWSVYLTATLIALVFFLTSKKVMGYYYVMLFPFLLAELVPQRRGKLIVITLVATTYISLAPYYAAWTNHAHWWVYALLGSAHSVFFIWLFIQLTNAQRPTTGARDNDLRAAIVLALGLFASATIAAWLQPLIASSSSPIRAPIVAAGMETRALVALSALVGSSVLTLWLSARATHRLSGTVPQALYGIGAILAPLFFSVYTLTKESTAIFEIALRWLGV